MSDQNMDPKKRNIIIGCSVAGAVVVIAAIIAVIFTTGALNKIGIGSSSANTVSYSDTERFSQGISIEGIRYDKRRSNGGIAPGRSLSKGI